MRRYQWAEGATFMLSTNMVQQCYGVRSIFPRVAQACDFPVRTAVEEALNA